MPSTKTKYNTENSEDITSKKLIPTASQIQEAATLLKHNRLMKNKKTCKWKLCVQKHAVIVNRRTESITSNIS